MGPFEVAPGIHWVGALDPQLRVFDVIIHADHGTTYNAWLVKGANGAALVDAVKGKCRDQLIANLAELVRPEELSYVVVNHTEPDHSGSLAAVLAWAPGAQLVASRNATPFLRALLGRPDLAVRAVGEADSLDLGGVTLRFIEAPFLHWPDTMFTHVPERKALFPCDFLGAHYCDDRMEAAAFSPAEKQALGGAFRFYFDCIMGPFKEHALRALARLDRLELSLVGPSHGPLLRGAAVREAMAAYRAWSAPAPAGPRRVAVFYVSAYGNTRRMAEEVAAGAREAGAEVGLHDLESTAPSSWPALVEAADAVAVGSPTINGDAVKPAWDLLSSLATVKLRGKAGAAFGSYAWSGEAVKMLEERMRSLKFKPAAEGVRAHFVPTAADLAACRALGAALAKALPAVASAKAGD